MNCGTCAHGHAAEERNGVVGRMKGFVWCDQEKSESRFFSATLHQCHLNKYIPKTGSDIPKVSKP